MTLILSLAEAGQAFQVIDRRVSLQSGSGHIVSVHDEYFNKTVLVRGVDGLCACSFTGAAYLGDIPMDQALAEAIAGAALDPSVVMTTSVKLPAISVWELLEQGMERFRQVWHASANPRAPLQVECVGLQHKSGQLLPFMRRYENRKGSIIGSTPLRRHAGRHACHLAVAGSGANLLPDQPLLEHLKQPTDSNCDLAALIAAIRRAHATEPSVGAEVIFIQIVPESLAKPGAGDDRKAVAAIGYDTENPNEKKIVFSPWILGQGAVHAPAVEKRGEAQRISGFLSERGRVSKNSILDRAVYVRVAHPRKPPPGRPK